MANVGFSSKSKNEFAPELTPELAPELTPEPIIVDDKSWYKIYCNKCPYFWHEDATEENKDRIGARCYRPLGEDCLAKAILVSQVIMMDMHNAAVRKMQDKPDHVLPFKHKKIKRKR